MQIHQIPLASCGLATGLTRISFFATEASKSEQGQDNLTITPQQMAPNVPAQLNFDRHETFPCPIVVLPTEDHSKLC